MSVVNGLAWVKEFNDFVRRGRHIRAVILGGIYLLVLFVARWLAFELRFDFAVPEKMAELFLAGAVWQLPLEVVLLVLFGQMYGILRYFSLPDFGKIMSAIGLATLVSLAVRMAAPYAGDPRGVLLLDMVFSIAGLTMVRLGIRAYWETLMSEEPEGKRTRVVVIGAGDVGAQLVRELVTRRQGMVPVAFLDDDQSKWKLTVHGVPVMGPPSLLGKLKNRLLIDKVVLAMPSASAMRLGEIVRLANQLQLPHETVPSMHQLTSGQVSVTRLRPVDIEDLLGRDMVTGLDTANLKDIIPGKVVAVTGAGGSIGSELCRQIAA